MPDLFKKAFGKTLHHCWVVMFLFACLFMLGDPGKLMKIYTASAEGRMEVTKVEILRVVPLSGFNLFEFNSLTTSMRDARKTGPGGLPHSLVIDSIPAPSSISSEASTTYTLTVSDNYVHPLTFAWTSSCSGLGSNGTFADASVQNPTWTAPENGTGSAEDCTISVVIDDGSFGLTQTGSFTQSVKIHLLTIDSISSPSAIDSEDSTSYTVTATDTLAHSLTYAWTSSCPDLGSNGTFADASAQNPTWTTPSFTAPPNTVDCTISVDIDDGSFGLTVSGSITQSVNGGI